MSIASKVIFNTLKRFPSSSLSGCDSLALDPDEELTLNDAVKLVSCCC